MYRSSLTIVEFWGEEGGGREKEREGNREKWRKEGVLKESKEL